ncbi:MAG: CDP-alcohol phosphatidyltransferase family protein [Clostridiales bacterium]|nr:CDP-alcohol phosphatidyltransferase family protein [Clostridiales bacterium]
MIKKIPNILSITRMVLSVVLIFVAMFKNVWIFIPLYLICGMTDIADGKIARHFKVESKLGEKLDSFGDVMVIVAALVCTLFIFEVEKQWARLIWVGAVILLRLANAIIAKIKFNVFNNIHTYGTKLVGAFAFLLVLVFIIAKEFNYAVIIAGSVFSLIMCAEETALLFVIDEYDVNIKGFLFKDYKKKGQAVQAESAAGAGESLDGSECKCDCGCDCHDGESKESENNENKD